MEANITRSKKRQSAVEIESLADLSSLLKKKSDSLYLLPGSERELPPQFDSGGREIAFVTLTDHKKIIEYSPSDQVISLCLGMTIGEAKEITKENQQFLPFSQAPESTLFDVINSGDGGIWEHSFGGPRDLVLGVHALLSDGNFINTGGKVVKNVTGYDTTKILVGGRMYFGIPLSAHFRLYARPEWTHKLELSADSVLELLDQAAVFMQSDIPITGLAICGSKDSGAQMLVLLSGHKVVVDELIKPLKAMTARSIVVNDTGYAFDSCENEAIVFCQTGNQQIEISASIQQMRLVLAQLPEAIAGGTPVILRPGSGRFVICCQSVEEKNQCLDQLRLSLEKEGVCLTAAYGNEGLERKIERLGQIQDGSSNQAIVRSLKLQFDQRRILNPLICW